MGIIVSFVSAVAQTTTELLVLLGDQLLAAATTVVLIIVAVIGGALGSDKWPPSPHIRALNRPARPETPST